VVIVSKKEQEKENIRKPGSAISSKIDISSYSNKSFFTEMSRPSKVNQYCSKNSIIQHTNIQRPTALPPLKPRSTKSRRNVKPDLVDSKGKLGESREEVNKSNIRRERQSTRSHNSRPRLPKYNIVPRKIYVKCNTSSKGSLSFLNSTNFNEYFYILINLDRRK
jgi:hypothetical protein